jgi:DnaJ-class molecular chaperone
MTVKGEGMPRKNAGRGQKGDLYVTLVINFPRTFTEQQKTLIRQAIQ